MSVHGVSPPNISGKDYTLFYGVEIVKNKAFDCTRKCSEILSSNATMRASIENFLREGRGAIEKLK